jgi:hypothetical protein
MSSIDRDCETRPHSPSAELQVTCTVYLLLIFDSLVCHMASNQDPVTFTTMVAVSGVNSD